MTPIDPPRCTVALSGLLIVAIAACSPSQPSPPQASSVQASVRDGQRSTPPAKPLLPAPENPDPQTTAQIEQYLNTLAAQGFARENQGIWIQRGDTLLANHQGTTPLSAASVTKIATSLVALQTFGPQHQFVTEIAAKGPIENGVLNGDLVILGGEDPFFVWEDAIPLGNRLNELGIDRVTGNLVIVGEFSMNFETDPATSGTLLQQALNAQIWPPEAQTQYGTLPPGTPQPQVIVEGAVQVVDSASANRTLLLRHRSRPLAELVKQMNMYSNNMIADMLAESVGGAGVVAQKAAEAAGVGAGEIQLINGSGLGEENRMSPRAACGVFLALQEYLNGHNMTLADAIAIIGKDLGVLEGRPLPANAVVKTGSLNYVSTLAGVIPTQSGLVWVAIMNTDGDLQQYRTRQEVMLQNLMGEWGEPAEVVPEIAPTAWKKNPGSRIEVVAQPSG
ncbi:D-alanyl-D-alanine carboxypeptidase [Phormidium sp. CCY1219]|uniref:D-alanyl-D-alanine carboxypeptidase n=1 Tax=Phormidium sp. CCY1219 TaxID=2886104 RepID=UPI002D1ECD01|nr:D-alanyl-D-alanine carboxypeptidase [Phormidium sp. CCY1219]MEB3826049.1 D-alanyl-D-alanine carboxypeptidase [Phormidium sp. CCY1219]